MSAAGWHREKSRAMHEPWARIALTADLKLAKDEFNG